MALCRVGKFVVNADYPGFGGDRDGLITQGWRVEEWTEKELAGALEMWGNLVDAITQRLPEKEETVDDGVFQQSGEEEELDTCLISSVVLDQYPAIPPFALAFLSRAKK
jgi:hypothetical protein